MANPSDLQPPPAGGFRVGRRRLLLEIVGVVGAFALVLWGAFALGAWIAVRSVPYIPVSADITIGEQAWDQLAPKSRQCTDPSAQAFVEAVAAPLVAALEDDRFAFKFRVVDDDAINAFALPGGFVTVNYGLLKAASGPEEVAAVLAHEIFHVVQRHGFRRILRQVSGWLAVGAVLGWVDLGSFTAVAAGLIGQGYDRDQERESDRLGRALLLKAQVDPKGMAAFFERLAQEKTAALVPAFLSTHPGSAERAQEAREGPGLEGPAVTLPSLEGVRCRAEGAADEGT
ncbi:MAG: M48 family metallopeptidase [Myxococcales bacterium]|nr:M48 family metallopeptidase [Myxococcales bacterium]MCB9523498.1 M48 family metallopeptidase [Myxococcales bacterium]